MLRKTRNICINLTLIVITILITVWLVRAIAARSLSETKIWHTASFSEEFRADNYPKGIEFSGYQKLEDRLFSELDEKIYQQINTADQLSYNRFYTNSANHPENAAINWNRSQELKVKQPQGGILLIHGVTDSPYSMRAIAELLQKQGLYVLVLRLPGHGTAPAALKDVSLDDWRAVVAMGVRQLKNVIPAEVPIYLGGYSTGGGLVVDYTLDTLQQTELQRPDGILLFSPAIGITSFARFISWDLALSNIPYFEKFAWLSINPEFDPYKYNSFPKIAGHLVYRLTRDIQTKIDKLQASPQWQDMPPVLTFQSLVDSTVNTRAIVTHFYSRLQSSNSELVLFDVNRNSNTQAFIKNKGQLLLDELNQADSLGFSYTLLSNENADTLDVSAFSRCYSKNCVVHEDIKTAWPSYIYSLAHGAIPFHPNDPIYGNGNNSLGSLQVRGEAGVLIMPLNSLMRLRYNPFFDYMQTRIIRFCKIYRDTHT